MRVVIIHFRRLMIGAALVFAVVVAGIMLLVKDFSGSSEAGSNRLKQDSLPVSALMSNDTGISEKPAINLDITMDGTSADVKILTKNFEFVKDGASDLATAVHGKGHAHLYLDGKMIGKVYDDEFILKKLPKGEHELRVELAYSNHTPYQVDAVKILEVK